MNRVDVTTPLTANSQLIQADEDDEFDEEHLPGFTHPGIPSTPITSPVPTPVSSSAVAKPVLDKGKSRRDLSRVDSPSGLASGRIGGSSFQGGGGGGGGHSENRQQRIGGVRVETRYTGTDTLDEPVSQTITRDLRSIYEKLVQVLYPRRSHGREVLRDWDLWGPLLLCLGLSIILSIHAPPSQSLGVFSSVIAICSTGALAVTVQAKLLGGRVSFFQGLCVLGYCVAPLNIAGLISLFVRIIWIRAPVALLAWAWSIWASVNFLDGTKIEQQRILLAVYPLLLFYFILAWMILIQ